MKETASGFRLVLPENIWSNARQAKLSTASAAKLEPLAALLASNPDYQILIEAYTDNRGDEVSLQAAHAGTGACVVRPFSVRGRGAGAHSGQRHGSVKPGGSEYDGYRPHEEPARRDNLYGAAEHCCELSLVPGLSAWYFVCCSI